MFDRFTERARHSMSLARQEAERFEHDYIGTEHILLGLVGAGEGVAVTTLANLGIEPGRIRSEMEKIVKTGTRGAPHVIPFTPRGKRVLELALEEAKRLGHDYIGSEHLLLGLIRERKGVAGHLLEHLGATLDEVRAEVRQVLGMDLGPGS